MVPRLRGKTVLVTGASMGIGRAVAKALAAEGGARVVGAARRLEEMERMPDEVEAAQNPRPILVKQDVMEEDAATKLRDAAWIDCPPAPACPRITVLLCQSSRV